MPHPSNGRRLKTSFYTGINDKWKMALAQIRVLFENMPCVSYCSGLQFSNPNPTALDFLCTKALFIRWDKDCLPFAQLSGHHLDSSSSNGFCSSIGDLSCSGKCSNFTRMLPEPNELVSFLEFQCEGVGFWLETHNLSWGNIRE